MVDSSKPSINTPVRTLTPSSSSPNTNPQLSAPPKAQAKPGAIPSAGKPQQMKTPSKKAANFSSMPFWLGMALSVFWIGVVMMALMGAGTTHTFAGLSLTTWAIGISAIASPVALIWMVTAYMQRAADVQSIAEPLRRQLMMITGESSAAEVRIRRFNQAIREQIELLRSTQSLSHNDLAALMDRVRQHKNDLEQFEQHSVYQVKEIQEVVRRSMQHIEQLLEDKFTMLRILDSKLVQSGDEVSRQTESVRDQMTSLLQEIEANSHLVSVSLERAARDSKKLADTASSQEKSLVSAAETASGALQELSGKIDMTIAHFLERVGSARSEAERLGGTLENQTKALDEISNTLPARISETENVLRSVTDRLLAGEQIAREQAANLSEHLENQVGGLQNVLDRFSHRLNDIDGHLQQRRSDLDGLVVRISGATDDLAQKLDSSVTGLGERAQDVLRKFTVVNEEARKGADDVASHMTETATRYESAIRQMNGLAEGNSSHLRAMTEEIAAHLAQFEALNNASMQAGQEVQSRAGVALQNLQHVLERLLSARDATQAVGETLTNNLHTAVQKNDNIIKRINEAAQMTLHALGVATDSLVRKEGAIATQSHAAESALRETISQLEEKSRAAELLLREQNASLTNILKETQDKLDSADRRLQEFASTATAPVQQAVQQIEQCTRQGSDSMDRYGNKMVEQINRLQQLSSRVNEIGDDTGRVTSDTLNALEQFNNRFLTVRAAQEETARGTLEQFSSMAERLQREVGVLNDHTTKAVDTLQQAAAKVGHQSQDLLREAQDSGSKIQIVTSALQNEAAQIRAALQKQADDLNADLSHAERQFLAVGESLKQRTDAAYALLDRMAAHYNDTTRGVTDDFEQRAAKLGQTATEANDKVTALNASLAQQAQQISASAIQMESQAAQLAGAGGKTLQQLSALNEKLSVTQESTASGAQQVIARLEETNSAFLRQNNSLSEAAQNAIMLVQKAGTAYGEQASKMLDTTHQVEQSVRSLNAATTSFADQTTQIRSAMEQHNQRLVASLNESVGQLDAASIKMQQATSHAAQGVDNAAARFSDMTKNASSQIDSSSQELFAIAGKTESVLGALGASITQQVASLNMVSEQISEQHRAMASASENHRSQLLDLFDKLGAAHGSASDVAERTIARLADSLQQIHRQLGVLSDQSQTALADVRSCGSAFGDQASLLFQNAQQAEQQARTVLSVTSALQDQARQIREALHAEGERTSDLFGIILAKLGSGNTELRELTSTAEITLTSLQNGVTNQTTALNSSMQQITDRQRSLTTALDSQRDVLNGLLNRLSLAHDETSALAERTAARLGESAQEIERFMQSLDAKAQDSLGSVRNASSGFATETEALNRNAEQAEQLTRLLCASATTLQEQTKGVREAIQNESEQLADLLGAMLGKLDSSSSKLQDIGTSNSAKLMDLQSVINEQTATLGDLMRQVTDRQHALTSSMETQRDTMGGLINRLALAQDETAASAERNIARLSESAQIIARQAELIDAQTQNALVNVRAAGAGFADEAGSLNLHAQQTEQQTRGLLSVTAGMQDQARQLRESMQNESARVIEHLTSVISQLDITSQQLKQQSGSIVNSVDQSVLQITGLANTTSEALQKHAQNIVDVAEKAEGRVLHAGDTIRSHLKVVAEAGEQAEKQAHSLADTAEHATSRLAALRVSLADSDKDGRDMLALAGARIEEIKSALQRELQQVAEISSMAVQQVAAAGQVLVTQSDALRANLSSSESALSQAADLVREEANQLPSVLDRSAERIDSSRKALQASAADVDKTMIQTADRFISVTGAARDTMMEEMRNLSAVASTADETLRQFNQALNDQIDAIKGGSSTLSAEQQGMVEKTAQTIAQLTAASDRLSQVRTSALQTTEKLAREFESIETMATSTTHRLAQAGEGLGKQMTQLAQMADRAEGQMTGASQNFREQLERIRSGVQMQIDDINRGLMQITAQLERTGNTLRSATTGAVTDVEKITTRLDQTSKDTAHQLTDRTARMRVATEEVAKLLNGFGDQMDVLLDRLSTAGDGIKRHENDLIGRLQTALSHLGSLTEKLETNRLLTADVADEAVSRLTGVSSAVEKQLHELKQGSDAVSGIVRNIGQMYSDQTHGMNRNLADTQGQVLLMSKAIEEMQQRTDRMRVALKLQGDDLMNTLENILHQMTTTGDIFGDVIQQTLEHKAVGQGQKLS